MKRFLLLALLGLVCALGFSACSFSLAQNDPCQMPELENQVDQVHRLMRAFDDTTRVIANTPRNQLNDGIVKLQGIRREAEDLKVPVCLIALKTYELAHMNAMIDTLIGFIGGADVTTVNLGVAKAQVQHDKYNAELSRLLGITAVPTATLVPTLLPPTLESTPSGDVCAPQKISAEVERSNQLMRAFDDWSQIAISTPKEKLQEVIVNLQTIRRQAQDNQVSGCLLKLKELQLAHMETVINTLLSFLAGSDATLVGQGIELARAQHDQYNAEVAALLGIQLVAPATATPDLRQRVQNPASGPVNIRQFPVENATIMGRLAAGAETVALGKSLDAAWILVAIPEKPGQTGWILASLLTIPDLETLPQVTPEP